MDYESVGRTIWDEGCVEVIKRNEEDKNSTFRLSIFDLNFLGLRLSPKVDVIFKSGYNNSNEPVFNLGSVGYETGLR
eukprot:CAMPEP_0118643762 /NCGR_PEP_ID=MMETSP0785-20121206/6565_1 /TAXON_ID=91992 /ORGANISM="Bolidomonas pacifica, Strain CCMP 1866" /LENGTH=76 /DNA_ID=CAMNT_0006535449 /DNA_START=556 /DNA_END=783 /DNA_ORIENTATION=+